MINKIVNTLLISGCIVTFNAHGFQINQKFKNKLRNEHLQYQTSFFKKPMKNVDFSGIWRGKCEHEYDKITLEINHDVLSNYITIIEYHDADTKYSGILTSYSIGEFTNIVKTINSKHGVSTYNELQTTNWGPTSNKLIHSVTSVMGSHMFEDREESSLELENNKLIYSSNYFVKWGEGNDFMTQRSISCVLYRK